jgi:hypothetical protein
MSSPGWLTAWGSPPPAACQRLIGRTGFEMPYTNDPPTPPRALPGRPTPVPCTRRPARQQNAYLSRPPAVPWNALAGLGVYYYLCSLGGGRRLAGDPIGGSSLNLKPLVSTFPKIPEDGIAACPLPSSILLSLMPLCLVRILRKEYQPLMGSNSLDYAGWFPVGGGGWASRVRRCCCTYCIQGELYL